jgi:hypothetical protein
LEKVNSLLPVTPPAELFDQIQQQATAMSDLVIEDFMRRLIYLQDLAKNVPRYDHLFQDLCRIAVQCTLLDRSTAFTNPLAPILISQALATMKSDANGRSRQQFAEYLAVEATSRFFLEHAPELLGDQMNKLLEAHQNDMCGMGKEAEVFLVWVRKTLRLLRF